MRRIRFVKLYLDVYEHTYPGTVSARLWRMELNVNLHLDSSVLQQMVFNRESHEIMAYV